MKTQLMISLQPSSITSCQFSKTYLGGDKVSRLCSAEFSCNTSKTVRIYFLQVCTFIATQIFQTNRNKYKWYGVMSQYRKVFPNVLGIFLLHLHTIQEWFDISYFFFYLFVSSIYFCCRCIN